MLPIRRLAPPALALLMTAAGVVLADQPRPLADHCTAASDQNLANCIAQVIRSSAILHHYRIDIACRNGQVELTGFVADSQQRDEVARLVEGVTGVTKVSNRIRALVDRGVVRTGMKTGGLQPAQAELAPPRPVQRRAPVQEPVPSYRAPMPSLGGAGAGMPPPMPPYAWPTFAPYNNFSRVAYPQAYPDHAFGAIGPVYPFPKVPLGWRKVTLEFNDGHWWLQTHGQKRDWWVLRYW